MTSKPVHECPSFGGSALSDGSSILTKCNCEFWRLCLHCGRAAVDHALRLHADGAIVRRGKCLYGPNVYTRPTDETWECRPIQKRR